MAKRVLIVDDISSNRKLMSIFMQDLGFEILVAVDGEETLRVLESEKVDLVLMDLNMPKMDGMSAIQQIRARSWDKQNIPVIVLTAFGSSKTRQKGFLLGITEMLFKPVNFPQLEQKIRDLGLL